MPAHEGITLANLGASRLFRSPATQQTSVDDLVDAKASKNPTDQQISIQANHPDFTEETTKISFQIVGRLA